MGEVIGTCGHKLRGVSDNVLEIKDYHDGGKCISTVCVCDGCAKEYKKEKIILYNEKQKQKYLTKIEEY